MENSKQTPQIEQKIVKFEIGKVLALVIGIVAIASLAGFYINSSYFQGNLSAEEISKICVEEPSNKLCSSILNEKEIQLLALCEYNEDELNKMLESRVLTDAQVASIKKCLEKTNPAIEPEKVDYDINNTTNTAIEPEKVDYDINNTTNDSLLNAATVETEPSSINPDLSSSGTETKDSVNTDNATSNIVPVETEDSVNTDPSAEADPK